MGGRSHTPVLIPELLLTCQPVLVALNQQTPTRYRQRRSQRLLSLISLPKAPSRPIKDFRGSVSTNPPSFRPSAMAGEYSWVLFKKRLGTLLALTGSPAVALADPTYGSRFSLTSYPPIFCVFTSTVPSVCISTWSLPSSHQFHHLRRGGPVQQIHRRRHQIVFHSGRRAPNSRTMPRGVADRRPPMLSISRISRSSL